MKYKNDVAFSVGNTFIVMIEQQSSINYNMPIRMFIYLGRIFEKITRNLNLYAEKEAKIPAPKMYVFYNGVDDYPVETEMRLSTAYKGEPEEINAELIVKVININYHKGAELLERCKTIREYSYFINEVRKFETEGFQLEESISKAMTFAKRTICLRSFWESMERR